MNLLASTGLVNYFGRKNDFESIELNPLLLKKGESRLAIYGLSYVNDGKLSRLFLEKKVNMPEFCTIFWLPKYIPYKLNFLLIKIVAFLKFTLGNTQKAGR